MNAQPASATARWVATVTATVVALTLIAAACGDDDSATTAGAGASTTSATGATSAATAPTSTSTTSPAATTMAATAATAASTTTAAPTTLAPTPPTATTALPDRSAWFDTVATTFLGFPLGTPAEAVADAGEHAFGAPDLDSGWSPSDCPPTDRYRVMVWGPVRLVLDDVDGVDVFSGVWYFANRERAAGLHRDQVRLPDGVAWGQPIADVATVLGVAVIDDPQLQSSVVTTADAEFRGDASTGPAVLDYVEIGVVAKCR